MLAIDEMINTKRSVQASSSHVAGSPYRVLTTDLPVPRPSAQQGLDPIPLGLPGWVTESKSRMVPGVGWKESGVGKSAGLSVMTHIHDSQKSWKENEVGPQIIFNNNNNTAISNNHLLSTYNTSTPINTMCIISLIP